MHAGSTLFFDVTAQRDCWPGGAWPLVDAEQAENVARLFALAARLRIRQAGAVCVHDRGIAPDDAATGTVAERAGVSTLAVPAGAPPHCLASDGIRRAPGCEPFRAVRSWGYHYGAAEAASILDRAHADYVASGCAAPPDMAPLFLRVFDHVTAGVRDAVVFGAGIEHGVDRAVAALLRRRIRTHVALDAAGSATPEHAQEVVATWKRRMVDVTTTAMIERLLARAG